MHVASMRFTVALPITLLALVACSGSEASIEGNFYSRNGDAIRPAAGMLVYAVPATTVDVLQSELDAVCRTRSALLKPLTLRRHLGPMEVEIMKSKARLAALRGGSVSLYSDSADALERGISAANRATDSLTIAVRSQFDSLLARHGLASAKADMEGRFVLEGLPAQSYVLAGRLAADSLEYESWLAVELRPGERARADLDSLVPAGFGMSCFNGAHRPLPETALSR